MSHDRKLRFKANFLRYPRVRTHKSGFLVRRCVIHGFRQEAPDESGCFWLTDEQFARIAPHLPNDTRGKPRVDDRRVISGIVHVLKSGARWVDAPGVYGPRKTLYNRFVDGPRKACGSTCFMRSHARAVLQRKS
ncbi:MAG: family transposase [Microvirga sp.]|nr:family transposase [Microvirga sp.]